MFKKPIILSLLLIVMDQAIKFLIAYLITLNNNIVIIKNFFSITYVKNFGAAWSILEGNIILLIAIAISALIAIYYIFIKDQKLSTLDTIGYGLLISGIAGNLIDRALLGYVVDYLEFNIFGYHFPIFNLADICIVISFILIAYNIYREGESNGRIQSNT